MSCEHRVFFCTVICDSDSLSEISSQAQWSKGGDKANKVLEESATSTSHSHYCPAMGEERVLSLPPRNGAVHGLSQLAVFSVPTLILGRVHFQE